MAVERGRDHGNGEVIRLEHRGGHGHGHAGRVDGGELVAQPHVTPGIDIDPAGAGADNLEAGATVGGGCGNPDGVGGLPVRTNGRRRAGGRRVRDGGIKLANQHRAFARRQRALRQHGSPAGRGKIRARRDAIRPRLGVHRQVRIEGHQRGEPHGRMAVVGRHRHGIEAIAEGVVENDIARRAQGEHAGRAFAAVAEATEIPVARGEGGRVSIGRVGGAEIQITRAVDDFHAGSEHEFSGQSGRIGGSGEQSRRDGGFIRVDEGLGIRVHRVAQGRVQISTTGDVVKPVSLDQHR